MYFVTIPSVGFTFIHNGRLAILNAVNGRDLSWSVECEQCLAKFDAQTDRDFSRVARFCSGCDDGAAPEASAETIQTMHGLTRTASPDVQERIVQELVRCEYPRHWRGTGKPPRDWFGYAIASLLKCEPHDDRYAINAAILGFIDSGVIEVYEGRDKDRKIRRFLRQVAI